MRDKNCNITKSIKEKMNRNIHNTKNHPIEIIKKKIYEYFGHSFHQFDYLSPKVNVEDNFDKLLIPKHHPARSFSDTYYFDYDTCLRTHTSAHQNELLLKGCEKFLVTGDVYRKDEIDSCHYPVFHQMEGVCIVEENQDPKEELLRVLDGLVSHLFPGCKYRVNEDYFPFTDPSLEIEVKFNGEWLEILGGGIIQDLENGVIGDPNPDFKVGFINTFTYKNLTFRAQFDWREGGDIQSISINSLLGRGVTKDTEDRERTFIIPGFYGDGAGNPILDSSGNQIPNTTQIDMNELYFSPAGGNTFGINTVDEGSVYDGTVYRLRELSLTYDLPSKWLDKTPFGKISLSVLGNNLWYFAPNVPKYTNFDPEVTSFGSGPIQGIENSSAPTSKRYGFKLNLTF